MNNGLSLMLNSNRLDYLNRSFKTLYLLVLYSFIAVAAYAVSPSE